MDQTNENDIVTIQDWILEYKDDYFVIAIDKNRRCLMITRTAARNWLLYEPNQHAFAGIHSPHVLVMVENWDEQRQYIKDMVSPLLCGKGSKLVNWDGSSRTVSGIS